MAAMSPDCPEKTRTLHNFSFPTWGSQKLLRCTKPNPTVSDHPPEKKRRHPLTASFRPETSSSRRCRKLFSGDDQIESIREKLIFDFRFEVAEMRAAILGTAHLSSPALPPPETAEEDIRPWNLRTRRAACKEPAASDGDGDGESVKFSVALSKEEIDDDFVTMIGKRPPRKAKKRHRFVQRQMDTLFPALWLPEKITPDMYTVGDNSDVGK